MILLLNFVHFAVHGEGSVPSDVLCFRLAFRRPEDYFPVLSISAAFDVVAKAGDVDDGSIRGLDEPAGRSFRRKILPSRPILASPTATIPTSEPEFAVHITEPAPGSSSHSVIVKRPGHAAVQRSHGLLLEAADKNTVSKSDGLLSAVTHAFGYPAVLPALAKVVANENLTVVADGKESTNFEVAEAANYVVRLAAVEEILEGMLPPIRVGIA